VNASHRKPSYFRHAAGAASAGDVEQVALGVVDFLQIGVVADRRYVSCKGITSSSQAITTTARNSRPLARCMVLIETCPLVVSTCSSKILKVIPASLRAARTRCDEGWHVEDLADAGPAAAEEGAAGRSASASMKARMAASLWRSDVPSGRGIAHTAVSTARASGFWRGSWRRCDS
jgi:hypothetical protein